jgi:ABC-type lipoprotein release transport system permease subunit
MSILRLILGELAHRQVNAWLSGLAVAVAVTLFVAFFTTAEASRRETTRLTRDLGFSLRIIPKETDLDRFWVTGFSDQTMPEETLARLARYPKVFLSYNHLVASLQRRVLVQDREVILTGLAPAVTAPAQQKQPMGYQIQPGTVILGDQVARRLGLKPGGHLELGGQPLRVERCLAESGTDDDIRVFGALADVQRVLGLPGRINEIKAIDCLCLTADQNPLAVLRAELEQALPEARVIQLRTLADARARQRQTTDRYFAFLLPLVLGTCALAVGLLAILNVRERKVEIGILRALGYGSPAIALLFLGKAVLLGWAGALIGYLLGSGMALVFGPNIFAITGQAIRPEPILLAGALVAAPIVAATASFIPAMLAVVQDPAVTLREA